MFSRASHGRQSYANLIPFLDFLSRLLSFAPLMTQSNCTHSISCKVDEWITERFACGASRARYPEAVLTSLPSPPKCTTACRKITEYKSNPLVYGSSCLAIVSNTTRQRVRFLVFEGSMSSGSGSGTRRQGREG